MIDSDHYLGQVLDEKYRLERLLGRGGMGAVYLATHLGTERYVALKLITPQFMRNEEFVARFKREARAAGRLRHPNVVDVTDFGFAHAGGEAVAYLVMEYLDGCTLGDILSEEKQLPLEWVVDILEQVCSAVHEAHQQGIVHRDLKPENIWLEPNRLGGYRVKVLDFGIAKLAEIDGASTDVADATIDGHDRPGESSEFTTGTQQPIEADLETETLVYATEPAEEPSIKHDVIATADARSTIAFIPNNETQLSAGDEETQMFVGPAQDEEEPFIATPSNPTQAASPDSDNDGDNTLMFDQPARNTAAARQTTFRGNLTRGTELTRVGAIMGTPLYMSPEQCAAKKLDARSDIYSLGVIAYQMLAGDPPFAGKTGNVMREHIDAAPPSLHERTKKVPKRAARVVMSALAKDPDDRPQTAFAFASALRAQAEGIGALYRRAFALYSEYLPKFLKLSLIAHIPVIVTTLLVIGLELVEASQPKGWGFARIAVIVALVIAVLLQIVAYFVAAAGISGMTAVIVTQLTAAPLRPVELRTAFAVLKRRWKPFLKTSFRVTLRIIIGYLLLIIPGLVITIRYALYAPVVLIEGLEKKAAMRRARELASRSWRTIIIVSILQFVIPMAVSLLVGRISIRFSGDGKPLKSSLEHQIYQQLSGLVNIVIIPLMSIVPALLYLKMRQLGGESLADALAEIEEAEDRNSGWQQRMRTRLSLHPSRGSKPRSRPD
jgi:serine/threonine protein kinase